MQVRCEPSHPTYIIQIVTTTLQLVQIQYRLDTATDTATTATETVATATTTANTATETATTATATATETLVTERYYVVSCCKKSCGTGTGCARGFGLGAARLGSRGDASDELDERGDGGALWKTGESNTPVPVTIPVCVPGDGGGVGRDRGGNVSSAMLGDVELPPDMGEVDVRGDKASDMDNELAAEGDGEGEGMLLLFGVGGLPDTVALVAIGCTAAGPVTLAPDNENVETRFCGGRAGLSGVTAVAAVAGNTKEERPVKAGDEAPPAPAGFNFLAASKIGLDSDEGGTASAVGGGGRERSFTD